MNAVNARGLYNCEMLNLNTSNVDKVLTKTNYYLLNEKISTKNRVVSRFRNTDNMLIFLLLYF